jgi:hypothetical protein
MEISAVLRINRMDVAKILEDLKREREQIEEAILTLERLAEGRGKRRGRPPRWLVEARKRGRPAANGALNGKTSQKQAVN